MLRRQQVLDRQIFIPARLRLLCGHTGEFHMLIDAGQGHGSDDSVDLFLTQFGEAGLSLLGSLDQAVDLRS